MTARKPKAETAETVTTPVIAGDTAVANIINAERDTAIVEDHALRSQRVAVEGHAEREIARIIADRDAKIASLDEQIAQRVKIVTACDKALAHLAGEDDAPSNVVAMAAE